MRYRYEGRARIRKQSRPTLARASANNPLPNIAPVPGSGTEAAAVMADELLDVIASPSLRVNAMSTSSTPTPGLSNGRDCDADVGHGDVNPGSGEIAPSVLLAHEAAVDERGLDERRAEQGRVTIVIRIRDRAGAARGEVQERPTKKRLGDDDRHR